MSYIRPSQHIGEYEDNTSSKRNTVSREEYLELLERTEKLEKRVRDLEQGFQVEFNQLINQLRSQDGYIQAATRTNENSNLW